MAGGGTDYTLAFIACLASAGWMCAWQARYHDRQRRELARASRTDPLTGCLNRRGFEERLASELARAVRQGRRLMLVMIDLDDFKQVNDTQGHAAGDRLLCWITAALRRTIRPGDTLGRLGGDEFALVLVDDHGEGGSAVARIMGALDRRASASTGIARFPADGTSAEQLQRAADADLYARKRRMQADARSTSAMSWATALATAVADRAPGSLRHCEAVADLATGIARRLDWPQRELEHLRLAALAHDVGKLRVSGELLAREATLNHDEFARVTRHPLIAAEIVARARGPEPVCTWVRHSHERFDGAGYPDGLAADEIPLASRILLVADAFQVIASGASRAGAVGAEGAVAELALDTGTHFDPGCIALLRAHLREVGGASRP